jgi:hypothetical protein
MGRGAVFYSKGLFWRWFLKAIPPRKVVPFALMAKKTPKMPPNAKAFSEL